MNKIHPKELVNYKRLDVVVKYLYAKELLEKEGNDYSTGCYEDLYIRHILMRTMGEEPQDAFDVGSKKVNIGDYIEQYQELIQNIKLNGFDKSKPIPIDNNNLLGNGAHMLAASLALDTPVYIQNIDNGLAWDFEWFNQNGFNTEDKQRILKGFVDLKAQNCAIFVIWNPLFKYIDNVKAVINNYFDIVGDVELDFENNYIAFTNALLEIYEPNIVNSNGDNTTIMEKSKLLQASYLSFKVIVVTNQNKNYDKQIEELSKNCKEEIRELFNHLLPRDTYVSLHSSADADECRYLSSILLSPNNIKHLKMRITTETGVNFTRRIRNLPSFLKTLEILTPNDVCVIGSGVMTALGVQKDSDSDFIIDYKYRDKLGWEVVYLNDDYDIGVSDKVANRPKNIPDNILIHNSEYHWMFKGIKFANLEMIKDRKSFNPRPKDLIHLRQIDLFEKMIGHFNQQKILMQRVEAEKQRRIELNKPAIVNKKLKYSNNFERIFSVKNEISNNKKYKVLTISGIRMKFKKRCK